VVVKSILSVLSTGKGFTRVFGALTIEHEPLMLTIGWLV
jgi:hypothetical protein